MYCGHEQCITICWVRKTPALNKNVLLSILGTAGVAATEDCIAREYVETISGSVGDTVELPCVPRCAYDRAILDKRRTELEFEWSIGKMDLVNIFTVADFTSRNYPKATKKTISLNFKKKAIIVIFLNFV